MAQLCSFEYNPPTVHESGGLSAQGGRNSVSLNRPFLFLFLKHHFLISSLTRNIFQLNSSEFLPLSNLLDNPWSHLSFLLPPRYAPSCLWRLGLVQYSHCSACSCLSIFIECRQLTHAPARCASRCVAREKVPTSTSIHSGGFEPASLTFFVGRRSTYTPGTSPQGTLSCRPRYCYTLHP